MSSATVEGAVSGTGGEGTPPGWGRVPRSVRRAGAAGAAAALVWCGAVLSQGRLGLADPRYTSDFYDVQARRLFDGRLDVPLETFGLEAFQVGDEYHTYFGVFPAVLRMPVLAATDRFDGRLTQLSMLVALALLLAGVVALTWRVRTLVRGDAPPDGWDLAAAAGAPVAAGAASAVVFLASATLVYHEAILWGVAATVVALERLVVLAAAPTPARIAAFGAAVAVAVLSRASLGVGPAAAAVALAVVVLAGRLRGPGRLPERAGRLAGALGVVGPRRGSRLALGLAAAALVPVLVHVGINQARFAAPLRPPFEDQVWTRMDEDRRDALEATDDTLFSAANIPSTVVAYARPDGATLAGRLPFVDFPHRDVARVGGVALESDHRTGSLPATSPALAVLAGVGAVAVARDRRLALMRLPALASLAGVASVLSFSAIAHRYLGDLVPALVVLGVPGAFVLVSWLGRAGRARRRVALCVAGIALGWSVWANTGLALVYQRLDVPADPADRRAFVDLQVRTGERLGIDTAVTRGPAPDAPGTRGALHVVGDCASLLWSDGHTWHELEPAGSGSTALCERLVAG